MKKWLFTIVTSLLLCACTSRGISIDDARKSVLKDAGLSDSGVSFSREDHLDGGYLFEFSDNSKRYSYKVDKNGNITSRSHSSLNDGNNSNNASDQNGMNNNSNTQNNNANSQSNNSNTQNNNANSQNNNQQGYISQEDAISIALKAYNLEKNQVYDIDIENEEENGKAVYHVEYYKDNQEYEVYIDKKTGQVINKRIDKDDRKVV